MLSPICFAVVDLILCTLDVVFISCTMDAAHTRLFVYIWFVYIWSCLRSSSGCCTLLQATTRIKSNISDFISDLPSSLPIFYKYTWNTFIIYKNLDTTGELWLWGLFAEVGDYFVSLYDIKVIFALGGFIYTVRKIMNFQTPPSPYFLVKNNVSSLKKWGKSF